MQVKGELNVFPFHPVNIKKVTWACLYSWVHSHERSIHSSQMQISSGLEAKKASYWHFVWTDTSSAGHILWDTAWSWHHYTSLEPELACFLPFTSGCWNNLSSPLQTPLSCSFRGVYSLLNPQTCLFLAVYLNLFLFPDTHIPIGLAYTKGQAPPRYWQGAVEEQNSSFKGLLPSPGFSSSLGNTLRAPSPVANLPVTTPSLSKLCAVSIIKGKFPLQFHHPKSQQDTLFSTCAVSFCS